MSYHLVGIGEVLWDLLPGGRQLGGAPANFAYHAKGLGADAYVISRVGNDPLGSEVLDRLTKLGLPTDTIEVDPTAPTSTVSVSVDSSGQPHYTIHEGVAWENLAGEANGRQTVMQANAVCFGTLAQRKEPARSTIQSLVQSTPVDSLRVFDINLRQAYYSKELIEQSLALANVLKVNDQELPILAHMFDAHGTPTEQIRALAKRFKLRCIACTRGAHGSILLANDSWSEHPGTSARVVDTVGAGDSFTAAMTLGLLAGWDLAEINDRANRIAAFVASSAGATPELPNELRALFCD